MDLENQLTSEIPQTLEQTEALARLQKLAAERGIRPLDFDVILSKADFWPEDESADDFIPAVEEWRRDRRSRDLP
jgi:hypothetical protein